MLRTLLVLWRESRSWHLAACERLRSPRREISSPMRVVAGHLAALTSEADRARSLQLCLSCLHSSSQISRPRQRCPLSSLVLASRHSSSAPSGPAMTTLTPAPVCV